MNNEDQGWDNCGQVVSEYGLLLTVLLSQGGGGRRSLQVEFDFMSIIIDLTPEQAQELSEVLIAPPLIDEPGTHDDAGQPVEGGVTG